LKVSKKTFLYIGIGVYVIVVASLAMIAFQRFDEQDKISSELATAQQNLARSNPEKLSSQRAELEEQLDQITLQYDAAKTLMSQEIGNVGASSIVFDIAESSNVEVVNLSSPSAWIDVLKDVDCTVISLDMRVEGDVRDLVDFIITLNNYLPTGFIKSIMMSIPEADGETEPSANILLLIYTYKSD
jgi:hypothetical protein